MKSVNPYDGSVIKEYREYTEKDVRNILEKVDRTYQSWKRESFDSRRERMQRLAGILRANTEEYARLITLEMGKIIRESRAEVEKCAWVCEYYAEHAESFLKDEITESDASKSCVAFEPIGAVLAVMPWNFPFWQVFRFAAPALMAGNTAVLKHASNVPGCALQIETMFREAGFPEDAFRSLLIPASAVEPVIRDSRIKAVTLTGSEPAGKKVASVAGSEIKKTVMELGGSDPFIVLEDADFKSCAETAARARLINAGQSCIAAKRFIVVQPILERFEEEQRRLFSELKTGDPMEEDTDIGPMARQDLVSELDEQVRKSVDAGARVLYGGKTIEGSGAFYQPTIITDTAPGMPVYEEETFGPVMAIIPAKDEEEAVRIANDSRFGLGGSLWTRDTARGEKLARLVESGAVFVNGMTRSDPRLPFGGIKYSGYGRELASYGIREFVNIKTIWIA